jgi:hypothetical protein
MKQKTILIILILSISLIGCDLNQQIELEEQIEEEPSISYPKLNPKDLTEQQLAKAKMMTLESQYKEFGGILVEEELKQEDVQELGYSSANVPSPISTTKKPLNCEEWAKSEIIPSQAQIIQAYDNKAKNFEYPSDSTAIYKGTCQVGYSGTPDVKKGSKQGQNINYYYMVKDVLKDDFFVYSKQIVSDDGTIQGDDFVKYQYVLDCEEDGETCEYKSQFGEKFIYLVRDCEVVDKIVLECNKVS